MIATLPIAEKHWSHRVDVNALADGLANVDGYWGEIVTGIADIEQCMAIVLTTPRGSVPTEPDKFCDCLRYIDRPPDVAIPMIAREAHDALTLWMPRIIVERVEVEAVDIDHYKCPVFWRVRADVLAEINRTIVDLEGEVLKRALLS